MPLKTYKGIQKLQRRTRILGVYIEEFFVEFCNVGNIDLLRLYLKKQKNETECPTSVPWDNMKIKMDLIIGAKPLILNGARGHPFIPLGRQ